MSRYCKKMYGRFDLDMTRFMDLDVGEGAA
jgi:hypothetical protein